MDDLCIQPKHYSHENIDYMGKNDISVQHLHLCWKNNNSASKKSRPEDSAFNTPAIVSRRLENICWRRSQKALHNLGEISPCEINWNKEVDITWLYGPKYTYESPFDNRLTANNLFKLDDCLDTQSLENEDVFSVGLAPSMSFDESALECSEEDSTEIAHNKLKPALKDHAFFRLGLEEKTTERKKKLVQFSYVIKSREFLNDLLFDYRFLDTRYL